MAPMAQSAEELKAQLKELSARRARLEQDIAVRTARLEAAGVGMSGSLVDREGFPRADVDIPAIRAHRHNVIAMTNDHKALSTQLEQLLHQLHALSRQPGSAAPSAATTQQQAGAELHPPQGQSAPLQLAQVGRPFAAVDEVSPASPASLAGIQLGDQLCRFGNVTADTPATLQQVAATLQAYEGREVEAVFLRHGAPIALTLVPQKWSGRGLLGCHLRPL